MSWRDEDEACRFGKESGVEPIVVYGSGDGTQSVRSESGQGKGVTGILDHESIARFSKSGSDELKRGLSTLDDDNLRGVGNNATELRDVARNCFTKRFNPTAFR